MATRIDNEFTSFDFPNEHEVALACTYTEVQDQRLQTMLAEIASIKVNLEPVGLDDRDFLLQHQFYKGQIKLLTELIETSKGFKQEFADRVIQQQMQMKD